ncbi:MAG: putative Small GTP-binding domain protein [Promethearchaeota archaeon]|nr:MAG: putative Small GTP-binding domain protein [Candidatus Lokiarchaeota archaeon]
MYYRGALGALLIFDLTSISSFEHLPQWIEEVRANVQTEIPLLLVGNKNDLIDQRAISLEEVNDFTRDFNLYYMETSAKTGDNVGDCFSVLASLMIPGKGVPDKLVGDAIYPPGQIPVTPQEDTLIPPEEADQTQYQEPVQPEEATSPEPEPEFVPEPTPEYAEPPEPEPLPEVEPVSEPQYQPAQEQYSQSEAAQPQYQSESEPKSQSQQPERSQPSEPVFFEPEMQEAGPDIPVPEPEAPQPAQPSGDFEFKTPDQIMAEDQNLQQQAEEMSDLPEMPTSSATESYKPKSVPFSSGAPQPTEPPEEFSAPQEPVQPTQSVPQPPQQEHQPKGTESLFSYMPEPEPEPESKKGFGLFSRKKKKEKEAIPEEEPEEQEPRAPSLFDTLSGRAAGQGAGGRQAAFVPFSAPGEDSQSQKQKEERSNLRIIPNAETIEEETNDFVEIPATESQNQQQSPTAPTMVTCPSCGARLSSEYAFCNKCGSKL